MIALATALPVPPLAISGNIYEIDYETGFGLSRKRVRVDRCLGDEDDTEVVGQMTDSGALVTYSADAWSELNPQVMLDEAA